MLQTGESGLEIFDVPLFALSKGALARATVSMWGICVGSAFMCSRCSILGLSSTLLRRQGVLLFAAAPPYRGLVGGQVLGRGREAVQVHIRHRDHRVVTTWGGWRVGRLVRLGEEGCGVVMEALLEGRKGRIILLLDKSQVIACSGQYSDSR